MCKCSFAETVCHGQLSLQNSDIVPYYLWNQAPAGTLATVWTEKLVFRFPVESRPFIIAEGTSPNTTPMVAPYSMGNGGPFTGLSG